MKKSLLSDALQISLMKFKKHPEYERYIHYSFIIQDNKIIEWGTNHKGIPAKHYGYCKKNNDPTFVPKIHSEIDAFKKAKGILNKSKIFEIINIRLNKEGQIRSSKPCVCCYYLLKELGCKTFHFTEDDGFKLIR